ncbi:unnamed protein product [Darwinula stevensoni]|uniref:Uncharacterized protein n=1 Tax=Darwinula stevensoni TaxID=69355 RepID=A0A7R8XBC9_9CRUS|nr:unnamed protein product [Darwinula stevensoni]CAG0892244.1 unnamed protein product [Darwinula stevensoni]
MEKRLNGKVVWITGAGSGIGRQLAVSMAKVGAKLVLHSLQGEDLDSVKALCLENAQGRLSEEDILILYGDIAEIQSHEKWVRHVLQHFKTVDILINNAGMNIFQKAYETPLDLTRRLFDVNLFGMNIFQKAYETPLDLTRRLFDVNLFGNVGLAMALLPHFRQRKAGHIVVTSSVLSFFSAPKVSAYCASKGAVQGFYDTLLMEEAGNGIKITTLQPGFVDTSIYANSINMKGECIDMSKFKAVNMDVASFADWVLVAIANKAFSACIAKKWILLCVLYHCPNLWRWQAAQDQPGKGFHLCPILGGNVNPIKLIRYVIDRSVDKKHNQDIKERLEAGFYDTLLMEEAGNGIKITTLQPGFVDTSIYANSINMKGECIDMSKFKAFNMDVASFADWVLVAIANKAFSACIAKKWILLCVIYHYPNLWRWIVVRTGDMLSNVFTKRK